MRILVVGAGMYVTGRGTGGPGTVLASLVQASKVLPIENALVVATRQDNAAQVRKATEALNALLGARLQVEYAVVGPTPAMMDGAPPDAAILCVPDHLHHAVAMPLLAQGVHCLVVKPLAPTVVQAREMAAHAQRHNVYGAVEFHKRWDESNLVARRAVAQGHLGVVRSALVAYSQQRSVPATAFKAWAHQTNVFQYLGVHYVDLVHFLTGASPLRAMAVGTRGVLDAAGVATWDSVHATVEWRHAGAGAETLVTQFAVGWVDPESTTAMSDQRLTLVGTAGRLDLDQKHRGVELVTANGAQSINPYFSAVLEDDDGAPAFAGYGYKSILRFLKDVLDLKAGRASPALLEGRRPTFAAGLISTAVSEAVTQSLEQDGSWRDVNASA